MDSAAHASPDIDLSPFVGKQTTDELGRRIRYFVTEPPGSSAQDLAAYVQGSGCHSAFRRDEAGRVSAGYQQLLAEAIAGQARVLVVEKPGVGLFDDPGPRGTAHRCSEAFLREHTLPRWRAAIQAAIGAEVARFRPRRLMVLGHSEGGIVAASVAASDPRVSHVALLASSGPTQLFDLATAARRRGATRDDADRAAQDVFDTYRKIMRRADSVTDFAWGHPFRRWSSFLATSALEELRRSDAEIYLVHGVRDRVVPIAAFDVLHAELCREGRTVTADRIPFATHAFHVRGDADRLDTIRALFARIVEWFLSGR